MNCVLSLGEVGGCDGGLSLSAVDGLLVLLTLLVQTRRLLSHSSSCAGAT